MYAQYALEACGIIAGNRREGWLSEVKDPNALARIDHTSILRKSSYYFHLPPLQRDIDTGHQNNPYPIVPTFRELNRFSLRQVGWRACNPRVHGNIKNGLIKVFCSRKPQKPISKMRTLWNNLFHHHRNPPSPNTLITSKSFAFPIEPFLPVEGEPTFNFRGSE